MTFRLFTRRTVLLPTRWGWLAIVAAAFVLGCLTGRNLAGFLSPSNPVQANILIVEGWLPDYALEQAKAEFQSKPYHVMVTTGVPIENGTFLSPYGTFARLAKASLVQMGAADSLVVAVPADRVTRDRTFASAAALKAYLDKKDITAGSVNLVSLGVHSRRSALLFRRALGTTWRVGVISVPDRSYDARRRWASSEGFRTVTGETIAWVYAATAGR